MPMRGGYADKIFIITSGENMAIHAAANIAMAVENFKNRGYAGLGGLILNHRDVPREEEKVAELADDFHTAVIGTLSHSGQVALAEEQKKTLMECYPTGEMADEYRALAMQMYPGNESEKPYIRKIIQEMKERYKVTGKTVQVADKGLNCARNIYAAVIEARDGYIFSKSVHGKGLSEKEKQWLLLENDANVYTDYRDKNGKLLFRLKSCVDTFSYKFRESDPETGLEKEISFQVKEKRIVSYNPSLAQKQKAEIMKMVDKATNYTTYKKMAREDLGDSVKYIQITNTDKDGKSKKPVIEINQAKIDEDLKYAGYNLLVTSELDMEPSQV